MILSSVRGHYRRHRVPNRLPGCSAIRADIAEGVHWLLGHRVLRTICWALTLENIAEVAGFVMLVLLAREELGLDARGYGLRAVDAGAAVLVALLAVILWWRLDAAVLAAARQAAAS